MRLVYLVPRDRVLRPKYRRVVGHAGLDLQHWYQDALGTGQTFTLDPKGVEVYETPHDASWYSTRPNGEPVLWFWNNVLEDAFALTGAQYYDPRHVWVFYIDAHPQCGQFGGAAVAHLAVISANDLRGLAGEQIEPVCPGEPLDQPTCRWTGGLGHELGHAFGLPHPAPCEAGEADCPFGALMWLGYITYPEATLTADDRQALASSPFFVPQTLPAAQPSCDLLMRPPLATTP